MKTSCTKKLFEIQTYYYLAVTLLFISALFCILKFTNYPVKTTFIMLLAVIVMVYYTLFIAFKELLFILLGTITKKHTKASFLFFLFVLLARSTFLFFSNYSNIYIPDKNNLSLFILAISIVSIFIYSIFIKRILKIKKVDKVNNNRSMKISYPMFDNIETNKIEVSNHPQNMIIEFISINCKELESYEIEDITYSEIKDKNIEETKIKETEHLEEFTSTYIKDYLKNEGLFDLMLKTEDGEKYFTMYGKLKDSHLRLALIAGSFMHVFNKNNLFKRKYTIDELTTISEKCFGISTSIQRTCNRTEELFNWVLDLQ